MIIWFLYSFQQLSIFWVILMTSPYRTASKTNCLSSFISPFLMVPILQWNCRSSKKIEKKIYFLFINTFAFQEMRCRPGDRVRFAGFSCFRDDKTYQLRVPFFQISFVGHSEYINVVTIRFLNNYLSVYISHLNHVCLADFLISYLKNKLNKM